VELRASAVDLEWSTPLASDTPPGQETAVAFEPDAAEREALAEVQNALGLSTDIEPRGPEDALDVSAALQYASASPATAQASLDTPKVREHAPTLPESEPAGEQAPAASGESPQVATSTPIAGSPVLPPWALLDADSDLNEPSALARALQEAAQARVAMGERDPGAPLAEAASSGTAPLAAVSAEAAARVLTAAGSQSAEHKSEADEPVEPPLRSEPESAVLDAPALSVGVGVALRPAAQRPFVGTTQRVAVLTDGRSEVPSSSFPIANRLSSDAPVVALPRHPEPAFGALLEKKPAASAPRGVLFGAVALVAAIGSFFLGRSSVSVPVRNETISAAKAEAPAPSPSALAKPPVQAEPAVASSAAAQHAQPQSASAPSEAVVTAPFDADAAGHAIADAAQRASSCRRVDQPAGRATVTVTFGPSGKVATANIAGIRFSGATMRNCMGSTFREAHIPAFAGPPVTIKKTLKM
jgi:hypothetical protein